MSVTAEAVCTSGLNGGGAGLLGTLISSMNVSSAAAGVVTIVGVKDEDLCEPADGSA